MDCSPVKSFCCGEFVLALCVLLKDIKEETMRSTYRDDESPNLLDLDYGVKKIQKEQGPIYGVAHKNAM